MVWCGDWHPWYVKNALMFYVQESPVEVEQLRRDKEELLNQVVLLQQHQESAAAESTKLCKKVSRLK